MGEDLLPLLSSATVLLFTATATQAKQEEIISNLKLTDPVKVIENPDRHNIYYAIIERPSSQKTQEHLDEILEKMSSDLKEKQDTYPLTIVYTTTNVIAYCFATLQQKLGKLQYIGDPVPANRVFAQYHQEYTTSMKELILKELGNSDSKLRVVFATVALGLGLDIPHIHHVIHYRPPTTLEQYFQETGRAGRDGKQAYSTMYWNNTDIRSNRPGIDKAIIKYYRENDCLRKNMLAHFGFKCKLSLFPC